MSSHAATRTAQENRTHGTTSEPMGAFPRPSFGSGSSVGERLVRMVGEVVAPAWGLTVRLAGYVTGRWRRRSRSRAVEEALRRRAEALVAADRRKNEVLATVAHELRTPLSVIPIYLRTIRRSAPDLPAISEAIQGIQEEVGQVVRLVDDLLDATRISRGKVALRKERLNLGAVIERAVRATGPLLASRNHQLAVSVPPEPVYLDADPLRLQQVVVNLLDNAAKYTNPGGRIWLTATLEGEEAVVLRVRDTGIGIVPERMSSIFELFTQGQSSQGGLGIGLAVVRNLLDMHEGTVRVRSGGLGEGSEFIVCLPVKATAT